MRRPIGVLFGTVAFLSCACSALAADIDGRTIVVTTLAGTGRAGNLDGSLSAAEFSTPSGVAIAADGSIYVSDRGLNTIRVITPNSVRTVAGTASAGELVSPGGFRDGPAMKAAFNGPEGIAVATDGAIYIADSLNHAIRKLHNGTVTTIAGGPAKNGSLDGPAGNAEFKSPRALALDRSGNLYVADFGNGVREISPSGTVTTLTAIGTKAVTGVAIGSRTLFAASLSELTTYDIATQKIVQWTPVDEKHLEGGSPPGFPYSVAAFDDNSVVFSDVRTNTIRYTIDTYFRVVAGAPEWDAENYSGGFADGPSDHARFSAPLAVAIKPNGSVVVADAGNHRIRIVSPWDRTYQRSTSLKGFTLSSNDDTIAWVGGSGAWTDTTWYQSIPGDMQRTLESLLYYRGKQKTAKVRALAFPGATLTAVASAIRAYFSDGLVKCVMLDLNSGYQFWTSGLATDLETTDKALKDSGIKLIVILSPGAYELSPVESLDYQLQSGLVYDYNESQERHKKLLEGLRASGVAYYDAWPDFKRAEETSGGPLFGTDDPHLTYRGRTIVAAAAVRALQEYYYKSSRPRGPQPRRLGNRRTTRGE